MEILLPQKSSSLFEKKKRRYRIASVAIFILGVAFSLVIWQLTRHSIRTAETSRFVHYTETIRVLVEERVDEHIAALRGLRAFIDSSEVVTGAEWKTFVDDLEIEKHFEGCAGFSFLRYVPRRDLEQYLRATGTDDPAFAVATSGNNPELFVVEMVEPLERNRRLVGYDLAQEHVLIEALREAARTDRTVVSPALDILRSAENRPGVLLLLPVYHHPTRSAANGHVEERLSGWVGAVISVGDLFSGIHGYFNSPLDIEVLDIDPDAGPLVLYDADGQLHSVEQETAGGAIGAEMQSRMMLKVANRTWELNIFALPGFTEFVTHTTPVALLLAGLLLSFFSAFLVASYGRPLERAQQLAEQMTRELRLSEQRFHKMFQEHNAVMLLLNPDTGVIVDANDAACRYYHYDKAQIVNMPIGRINPLSNAAAREAMKQVREKRHNHFEFKHILGSGEVRDVEVYSSPIEVEGLPLLFSIVHDITERKQAEKELSQYRENLESLVEEQTQKLEQAHSELLQQERLATLGKLTATVSHELRNPLGTIKTSLFAIADGLERNNPEAANRPLELAERNIDRCVTIIEELNGYARVKRLNLKPTVLDDWLSETVSEQDLPSGIRRELDLAGNITVSLDQEKLRQVIVNLISNAVHALLEKDAKEKLLKISSRLVDDWYEIEVCDNGVGMSEETRQKIFEPLYSTKGFGVGLGMVIVEKIIKKHHGEIRIDSTEGEGTTVTLRLPRSLPEGAPPEV